MKEAQNLNMHYDFFSAKRINDIVLIRFKDNMLFRTTDLSARDVVLGYLDRVSASDLIKVIVIFSSPDKSGIEEYIRFYDQLYKSKWADNNIHRMCNVVDQFIMKIIDSHKIIVHANSGSVISLYLNVSLACDYRIVADNTIFQNPYLELGLLPKGGGPYFLSKKLGFSKAYEILLSGEDITAQEALRLGIVDKVVPMQTLESAAMKVAQNFAQKPARTLAGMKKLMQFSLHDLEDYLDLETQELLRIVEPSLMFNQKIFPM